MGMGYGLDWSHRHPVTSGFRRDKDCPDQPPGTDTPPEGCRAVGENNLKGDYN